MHFFIDHAVLPNQPSTEGFGPSFADPANKYDVSANFKLTEDAKAFACQPGHIIVTDFVDVVTHALDPNLVNVILKPMAGLTVTFPMVKYYIYRGIKRDSFFAADGSFNTEPAPSNCDTVREMWKDWHANVARSPDALVPGDLGFDASLAGIDHIEEIFDNSCAPLRARQVKEGEWIGTFGFSKEICLEVIVEAELLDLNLDYARKSKVQIDISNMASSTARQEHALRCEKEKILAFVDPAALFGMHFSAGVSGFGLADAPSGDTLATTFLSHFSTATRVYLDIRSDKGYSYNFYDNYGGGTNPKLIQFKAGTATAFADDVYLNHGWPLFSQSGWTGPDATINLSLRLRIDDNTRPLLFVEDASRLFGMTQNFLDEKDLLDGAATDWSQAFNLRLDASCPAIGNWVCVATHVRMQYMKQEPGAVMNPRLLQFNHRLDTVFGGINLSFAGSEGAFGEVCNEKVGLAAGPTFAHLPQTGMYFDSDVVLLYGSALFSYRVDPKLYPSVDFAASTLDNVVRSKVFPSDTVFNRWSIVAGGATIRIIDLSAYKNGAKNSRMYGIHFLGLTRAELTALKDTMGSGLVLNFGPVHQRFLVFEEAPEQFDDNTGFPYKRYEVKVQGLDVNGQRTLVAPSPALQVYGAGANMVCSKDFAALVELPDVPPDPGQMNPWEDVFTGTYQKGDPSVDAVEPTGAIIARDIGNDFGIKKPKVKLLAQFSLPVDKGGTTPSLRRTTYPLVVIVHGNGHVYTQYKALGEYLAHNGFIVASVNLLISKSRANLVPLSPSFAGYTHKVQYSNPILLFNGTNTVAEYDPVNNTVTPSTMVLGIDFLYDIAKPLEIEFTKGPLDFNGLGPRGRANVIFKHLEVLKHKFGTHLQDNIGLIGHSRGGEAVVRAAEFIQGSSAPDNPDPLRAIKAIISLAPTDYWEEESLTEKIPYFVLCGSRDGDVRLSLKRRNHLKRWQATVHSGSGGFTLYDRAQNQSVKSMAFVHGANHNGFITTGKRDPVQIPPIPVLPDSVQSATAIAYMNAFLRQHLLGEVIWKSYFTGEFIPGSITTKEIFMQYKEMVTGNFQMVDNFEPNAVDRWARSYPGTAVLVEGFLNHFGIDEYSPHETFGLKITDWVGPDTITFTNPIGATGIDIHTFKYLSFRITEVVGRPNFHLNDLKVVVKDTISPGFAAPLSRTIPYPDSFGTSYASWRKAALLTVRIPLSLYEANGVQLTKVELVQFEFPKSGFGSIEIDDVEFTQ